jgi:hypothetical protein
VSADRLGHVRGLVEHLLDPLAAEEDQEEGEGVDGVADWQASLIE